MAELDDRLSAALGRLTDTPLAEPEPVPALRKRARRHRTRRALAATTACALACGALVGVLVVTHDGHDDAPNDLRLLAPNVLLGDIDAVVLSNTYDENGARNPIPASVRNQLAAIPGVQEASGIVQRFVPITAGDDVQQFHASADGPPRTPVLFSYHEGSEVALVAGALPTQADQLLIDRDLADRIDASVGDRVTLELGPPPPGNSGAGVSRTVSGIFELPAIDTAGVPLAAVPATQPLEDGTFDRIDLALDPDADLEAVRAAVAGVLGDAYVTLTPTQLGLADQRDAEIGIQHAYWSLLSRNAEERYAAREFDGTTREQADEGYARYKDTADQAELRIQRVNFVAPDRANVVYRIYYGGAPSPIITDPQNGAAVLVDGQWRIAASTTCQLATYVGQQCAAFADKPVQPPDGWNAVDSALQIAAPFRVVADPDATVDARVAAIATSPSLSPAAQRAAILDGVAHDRKYSGRTRFLVIGLRDLGDHAQVLYSLTVDGADGLNTPYPVIGNAVHVGDQWLVDSQYLCGIVGLAQQGCPATENVTGAGPVTTMTAPAGFPTSVPATTP
jgi:hypothetical protein